MNREKYERLKQLEDEIYRIENFKEHFNEKRKSCFLGIAIHGVYNENLYHTLHLDTYGLYEQIDKLLEEKKKKLELEFDSLLKERKKGG